MAGRRRIFRARRAVGRTFSAHLFGSVKYDTWNPMHTKYRSLALSAIAPPLWLLRSQPALVLRGVMALEDIDDSDDDILVSNVGAGERRPLEGAVETPILGAPGFPDSACSADLRLPAQQHNLDFR